MVLQCEAGACMWVARDQFNNILSCVTIGTLLWVLCGAVSPPVLCNPGGIVQSDIQNIVLTIVEYFHLRGPSCRALITSPDSSDCTGGDAGFASVAHVGSPR